MLAYRHGFHAGAAADVFKHSALIHCLRHLVQKEKPCLFVDTHAGAGSYNLAEGFSAQSGEWKNGIGKIAAGGQVNGPLPAMLEKYREICGAGTGADAGVYPGSPEIMARFLRPEDRLVCFELHPGDFDSLSERFNSSEVRAEARKEDGLAGLLSLLPPPSRRGLIFIDPSYEIKDDFDTIPGMLQKALKRFSGGMYIVWYPLLETYPAEDFAERLMGLYRGNRCRAELHHADKTAPPANSPRGFYGSGLVIFNPPWTLRPELENTLPALAALYGNPGKWLLQWEEKA
ncbi:ribosomal RNA large subunit methyltransferase J [Spirochaetia bacterium]|nr:ribosomal RNA large subunit methyltransferase J [Spirochaetia bacterium]